MKRFYQLFVLFFLAAAALGGLGQSLYAQSRRKFVSVEVVHDLLPQSFAELKNRFGNGGSIPSMPILFKGAALGWPIMSLPPEVLAERYGEQMISIEDYPDRSMREYVAAIQSGQGDPGYYTSVYFLRFEPYSIDMTTRCRALPNWLDVKGDSNEKFSFSRNLLTRQLMRLQNDDDFLMIHSHLARQLLLPREDESVIGNELNFLFGPKYTKTRLHSHVPFIFVQIYGQKDFLSGRLYL